MKFKPPLKTVNGTVLVQTKKGWRDIKGMQVQLLVYEGDKPRFKYGFIKHVVENRIQISLPSYRPGQDDKFHNTTIDNPAWTFNYHSPLAVSDSPRTLERLTSGPRCDRARTGVHPVTYEPILLQCVMKGSHSTCHFENPSNEQVTK